MPTHLVPVQKVQPLRAGHHRHVGGDIQRRLSLLGLLDRWILADGAVGAEKLEEGHGDAGEEAELRAQRYHAHDTHDEHPEIAARGTPERLHIAKLRVREEEREKERERRERRD